MRFLTACVVFLYSSSVYAFPGSEAVGVASGLAGALLAHISSMASVIASNRTKVKKGKAIASFLLIGIGALMTIMFLISENRYLEKYESLFSYNFQKTTPDVFPRIQNASSYYFENLPKELAQKLDERSVQVESLKGRHLEDYQVVAAVAFNMLEHHFDEKSMSEIPMAVVYSEKTVFHNVPVTDKPVMLVDRTGHISKKGVENIIRENHERPVPYYLAGGFSSLIDGYSEDDGLIEVIEGDDVQRLALKESVMFVDAEPFFAFDGWGRFYKAKNTPFLEILTRNSSYQKIAEFRGDIVLFSFGFNENIQIGSWLSDVTGKTIKVVEGGYSKLEKNEFSWVPPYKNKNRVIEPKQAMEFLESGDVVFLDLRSSEQFDLSLEKWASYSLPISEYSSLKSLRALINEKLPKNYRYSALVYGEKDSFKAMLIGYILHTEGYDWLGLTSSPNFLSHSILKHSDNIVPFERRAHDFVNKIIEKSDVPVWIWLVTYGALVRLVLMPLSGLSETPVFVRRPLPQYITASYGLIFIGLLVFCAYSLQEWAINYGLVDHAESPFKNPLFSSSESGLLAAGALMAIQIILSRSSFSEAPIRAWSLSIVISLVILYFLRGLPDYLYLYMIGVSGVSIVLCVFTKLLFRLREPQSKADFNRLAGKDVSRLITGPEDVSESENGIKAGRLGDLWRAGFEVPTFFVIHPNLNDTGEVMTDQEADYVYRILSRLGSRWMLRSAAKTEDRNLKCIGKYLSKDIDVTTYSPDRLKQIMKSVLMSQSDVRPQDRQVIAQRWAEGDGYGVLISRDLKDTSALRFEYGSHGAATEGGDVSSQLISRESRGGLPRLAKRLENRYGEVVDIELALKGREVYILQCRPFHLFKNTHPVESEAIRLTSQVKSYENLVSGAFADTCPSPDPLSLSIILEVYGRKVVSAYGHPLINKRSVFIPIPAKEFKASLEAHGRDTQVFFETIKNIHLKETTLTVKSDFFRKGLELLNQSLVLASSVRGQNRLRKHLDKMDRSDAFSLLNADFIETNKSDFVVPHTFSLKIQEKSKINAHILDFENSKMPVSLLTMTAIHLYEASIYEGLRRVVWSMAENLLSESESHDLILGANCDELIAGSLSHDDLRDRISYQKALLEKSGIDTPRKVDSTVKRIEGVIYKPGESKPLDSERARNSIIVLENGRSDLIGVIGDVQAIMTRRGGFASHWYMLAIHEEVAALPGISDLDVNSWEDGASVCLI